MLYVLGVRGIETVFGQETRDTVFIKNLLLPLVLP